MLKCVLQIYLSFWRSHLSHSSAHICVADQIFGQLMSSHICPLWLTTCVRICIWYAYVIAMQPNRLMNGIKRKIQDWPMTRFHFFVHFLNPLLNNAESAITQCHPKQHIQMIMTKEWEKEKTQTQTQMAGEKILPMRANEMHCKNNQSGSKWFIFFFECHNL